MGRKVHSKLLFTSSANTDGFYTFYISQGSAATQLRCGGMFGNHFTTNFSQNVPLEKDEKKSLKIGQYLAKIWTKLCGLLFGPPCITPQKPRTLLKDMSKPTWKYWMYALLYVRNAVSNTRVLEYKLFFVIILFFLLSAYPVCHYFVNAYNADGGQHCTDGRAFSFCGSMPLLFIMLKLLLCFFTW